MIKSIGSNVSDVIVSVRGEGFKDYFDFVKKVNCKGIGIKTIELLIMAGCCDTFNLNRKTMIENLNDVIDYSDLIKDTDEIIISTPEIKIYEEYDSNEMIKYEKEIFGFYLSNHPITKYNNSIKLNNISNYFDKTINMYVYVEEIRKIKTKNNEDMAFLRCSDETEKQDFIVFPKKFNLINDVKVGDKYDRV